MCVALGLSKPPSNQPQGMFFAFSKSPLFLPGIGKVVPNDAMSPSGSPPPPTVPVTVAAARPAGAAPTIGRRSIGLGVESRLAARVHSERIGRKIMIKGDVFLKDHYHVTDWVSGIVAVIVLSRNAGMDRRRGHQQSGQAKFLS